MNYSLYVTITLNDIVTLLKMESNDKVELFTEVTELINNRPNTRLLEIEKMYLPEVGKPYGLPYEQRTQNTLPQNPNDPCYLCGAPGLSPKIANSKRGGQYCQVKKGDNYCDWTSKKHVRQG